MIATTQAAESSSDTSCHGMSGTSAFSLQPSALFSVPSADTAEFAALPEPVRLAVSRKLHCLRAIAQAPTVSAGARAVAAQFSGMSGFSRFRLRASYYEYLRTQDWRVLINRAVAGPRFHRTLGTGPRPDAFLDFCASQWALNQRDKFRSVHHAIVKQWERWSLGDAKAAIPGYQTPPPAEPRTGLPFGWRYGTLHRQLKRRATKWERRMVQIGPKAASHIGVKILTSRANLTVGQYYVFDDSWNDFKVVAGNQTVRLLAFHALDLFSGCNIARGYKPALSDERGIEERLREREIIWLLAHILTRVGYRPAGSEMICEKATATIREREAQLLYDHTGGAITVKRGPAGGGPGIGGLFTGPSGGNPRWKAPLESWFNLLRNRTANILEFPGQTGSNSRLNLPESLDGIERETKALLAASQILTPQRAELLQLGMLSLENAIFALDAVTTAINERTDHSLEGWRAAGHYVTEWRPRTDMPWVPSDRLLDLPAEDRARLAAALDSQPYLRRERPLSPAEVFETGRGGLKKLDPAIAALLLADIPGAERPVKQGILEVNCPEVDRDEPLRYGLARRDGRGAEEKLRDGETWLVRVNPLDPAVAWLYDARGGFAGVANAYGRVCRADADAVQRACAEKRTALSGPDGALANARRLAAPITRAATARAAHNAAVLSGTTPEDKAKSRALRNIPDDPALAEPAAIATETAADSLSMSDLL